MDKLHKKLMKQIRVIYLFLVDSILQNTDKQSQLFGQVPGKSHADPLKTIFF